ncbi:hypothetical protein JMN32_05200 [Fulvivirga sp. 29W222]|uniref:Uncharacterized protein n=1 Tax=Fulvivirga marina TaxID=2494733 RepID=A0A937FTR5_9BACT|nr:hypothetical protein [Fulvivirga marina]MBL6445694.1 hypothetical protein [Fulvivirga marina]
MINIASRLKDDLTVVELIELLKSASNPSGYILVPFEVLSNASRGSHDTINYCKEHGFIRVEKSGKKCYEFYITAKGLAFLKSRIS